MSKKINELLEKQKAERIELATNIIEETVTKLDCVELLESIGTGIEYRKEIDKYAAIVKDLEAKIADMENSPVKEVEVIKEVTKEVPVESAESIAKIKELETMVEALKKQNAELEIKNVELEAKHAELTTKNTGLVTKHTELENQIKKLNSVVELKDEVIASYVADSIKNVSVEETKEEKKIDAPTVNTNDLVLEIKKHHQKWIFGTYNGVAFQAAKNVKGVTVFDANKYDLQDEIFNYLVKDGILNNGLEVKDPVRIENSTGVCNKVDRNSYTGFVMYYGAKHCYFWNTTQKDPATIELNKRLNSKCDGNYKPCFNDDINARIRALVEEHKKAEAEHNAKAKKAKSESEAAQRDLIERIKARNAASKATIDAATVVDTATTTATVNTETTVADTTTTVDTTKTTVATTETANAINVNDIINEIAADNEVNDTKEAQTTTTAASTGTVLTCPTPVVEVPEYTTFEGYNFGFGTLE